MTKEEVIKEFSKIKGVGKTKAEQLYKNGFDSIEKLKKAKVKDFTKIDGITESIAKNILKQIEDKAEPKKTKTKTPKKVEKETKTIDKEPKKEEKQKEIKVKEEKKTETKEEEKEKYIVKKKPKLSKELEEKLRIRKQINGRRPEFLREEWFRYGKISKTWRKPDGMTSKMRINLNYRPSKVRIGFRGPKETRGLHPSGFKEVIIHNVNDLEKIDPKIQAARIGSSVGTKKRMDIEKKAQELEVRILNI